MPAPCRRHLGASSVEVRPKGGIAPYREFGPSSPPSRRPTVAQSYTHSEVRYPGGCCKGPIAPEHLTETIRFDDDEEHRLQELNGTYHAECAKPILSIKRALDILSRGMLGQ